MFIRSFVVLFCIYFVTDVSLYVVRLNIIINQGRMHLNYVCTDIMANFGMLTKYMDRQGIEMTCDN